MTSKKRLHPAVFATVVVLPIVILELVLVVVGVWPWGGPLVFVLALNVVFWLINFFVWRQAGKASQ